jgi:hypothetical protein
MGKKYVMASTTEEETTISKGETFPICFYLIEAGAEEEEKLLIRLDSDKRKFSVS